MATWIAQMICFVILIRLCVFPSLASMDSEMDLKPMWIVAGSFVPVVQNFRIVMGIMIAARVSYALMIPALVF